MANNSQIDQFDVLYDSAVFHEKSPQKIRSKVFNYIGFPSVSYKEDHYKACREYFASLPVDVADESLSRLRKRVESIILFLNKISVFCRLSDEEFSKVFDQFSSFYATQSGSQFYGAYPNVPKDPSIVSVDYEVFKRYSTKAGDVDIFCMGRKRRYHQSFDIDVSDISDDAVDEGVTLVKATARGLISECSIDQLVFHHEAGIVECRLGGASHLSGMVQEQLLKDMNMFVKKVSGVNIFNKAINFFPAITPLYHEKDDDCYVTKLGFSTKQGVGRQEKSRRDKVDIRGELYHMEGAKAIDHTFDAYGIRKKWDRKDHSTTNEVKLEIRGSSLLLGKPHPEIDRIFLLGAYRKDDYNFLIRKALAALKSE